MLAPFESFLAVLQLQPGKCFSQGLKDAEDPDNPPFGQFERW